MAPTEGSILSNFLLLPAPLPTFITLQKFAELFPKSQREHPQIKLLYRELQYLRGLQTDEVKRNIAQEVKRGERQQREVVKARRTTEKHEMEDIDGREIEMETEVKLLYNSTFVEANSDSYVDQPRISLRPIRIHLPAS